jgi:uncharacterized protein
MDTTLTAGGEDRFSPSRAAGTNRRVPARVERAMPRRLEPEKREREMAALVLAKAPRPGYAKTRLGPALAADDCARLQAALTRHALDWACAVAPRAAFLAYAPADAEAELRVLGPPGIELFAQAGGDLGARLKAAVERVFSSCEGPLVVVGADCPGLAPRHARMARAALDAGADVCFGPAYDGGYYLVALREPRPELFALPADAWGGPTLLELSLRAAKRHRLRYALIEPQRDLDRPRDARLALSDPATPPEIVEVLAAALRTELQR